MNERQSTIANDMEGNTLDGDWCPPVQMKQGGTCVRNLEEGMESSTVIQSRREERDDKGNTGGVQVPLDLMHSVNE